ncbi:hypothetical protein ACFPRL_15950 [Pseudoclavibacter helvolus]
MTRAGRPVVVGVLARRLSAHRLACGQRRRHTRGRERLPWPFPRQHLGVPTDVDHPALRLLLLPLARRLRGVDLQHRRVSARAHAPGKAPRAHVRHGRGAPRL